MASYTMPLKVIIEQATQYETGLSNAQKIEKGRKHLFDFDYPIFDENYRKTFETNFIREFYTREIGFETEGLFKFKLETWLLINMPYWNKMYESVRLKFDPLKNVDVTRDHKLTKDRDQNDVRDVTQDTSFNSDKKGNVADDNFSRGLESDTPDKRLAITTNDGQGVIEYASRIDEETENNKRNYSENQNGTGDTKQKDVLGSEINEVEDYVAHEIGKIGNETYSEMVIKYRQSLFNVERELFNDMNELFMLIY